MVSGSRRDALRGPRALWKLPAPWTHAPTAPWKTLRVSHKLLQGIPSTKSPTTHSDRDGTKTKAALAGIGSITHRFCGGTSNTTGIFPSSRLGSRAHHRSRCDAGLSSRAASASDDFGHSDWSGRPGSSLTLVYPAPGLLSPGLRTLLRYVQPVFARGRRTIVDSRATRKVDPLPGPGVPCSATPRP